MNAPQNLNALADRPAVESLLREFMTKALPSAPSEEDIHIPFLEMGANSLVLMEVQRAVESHYGITIAIPQFFQELTNMDALADYIVVNQVPPAQAQTQAPAQAQPQVMAPSMQMPAAAAINPVRYQIDSVGGSELEAILMRQIETASQAINQVVAQQLQFLGEMGMGAAPSSNVAAAASAKSAAGASCALPQKAAAVASAPAVPVAATSAVPAPAAAKVSSAVVSHRMLSPLEIRARGLNPKQSSHLEALIANYTSRTKLSKELAARDRGVLADSRAAVGFRFTTKEMLYPIVGKKAQGANVWDIDGNKYIDITMGQGVTLFGHHPKFIDDALADPENDTLLLGPRPPQTGEAARLICEMTGMDRVTFTNTGTEAVMAALRIARAATKRNKIVMFDNAYHGHSDNVMGRPVWQDGQLSSVPVAPGITQGSVDDLLLLDYGSDEALEYIRKHGHELAAVMVEPVQSRRPDLQPREFLHALRKITEECGALLIFDEMITGFRVHQGGAQAWFGVRADLATYGKVLAGGMPIGVVAGKAHLMDAIDGGMWNYGDATYPVADRTIFGGTFCQHPTAMITTLATLRYLKEQGPALQEALNRRTQTLAAELNDYFDVEDVPIRVVHFGSLFRFAFSSNLELLFYHLMEKGIFIWEWRNYFLSTAHSDADVAQIVQAVKECIVQMRAGGFLPERSEAAPAAAPLPLSVAQQQLSVLAQIAPEGSMAYHVSPLLQLKGHLEVAALRSAVREVMRRHEALRTVIVGDQQQVMPLEGLSGAGLSFTDLSAEKNAAQALAAALAAHANQAFDLAHGPLFEAHLFKLASGDHQLLLKGHHIVVDGLSLNLIVQDLAALYSAALQGLPANLPNPLQLRDYVEWRGKTAFSQQEAYWLKQLSGNLPVLDLPLDRPETQVRSYQGGRHSCALPAPLLAAVRTLSRAQGCTDFMTLFAAYALWLHRLCAQDELLVGMPVAGRNLKGGEHLVGYCTHLIPIRSRVVWDQPFTDYLRSMRDTLLNGYQHQDYPFAELINHPSFKTKRGNLVSAVFNLDRPGTAPAMAGLKVNWLSQPVHHTAFALTLNLTEVDDAMVLECDYSRDLFDTESIERYVGHFLTLLNAIVATPQQSVAKLPLLDAAASQQLLVDWNDTAADYPKQLCAHQLFEAQAERTPQAIALRFGEMEMTYADLNVQANRLAAWLQLQGVGPEVVVGMCAERAPELVIGLLATLKAGGAYLPLDPAYPPQRLAFMLADAGAPILLTQEHLAARIAAPEGVRVICLDTQREIFAKAGDAKLEKNPASTVTPDNLAYLIYTSGSTGQPKGTLIVHQGFVNYLSWALQRYEAAHQQGEGSPLHSSISFDATITSLFTPLIAGKALTLLPEGEQEIETIRAALQSGRLWNAIKVTPAHLELLNAMIPPEQLAGMTRFVVLGGEALLDRHVAPWRQHAPDTRLINEYGPTETVVGCCVHEVDGDNENDAELIGKLAGSVPIGRPIANTQLYVLDANRQPVPVGVKGELYIGGDGVARGYHRRPELSAERFVEIGQTGIVLPGAETSWIKGRLYRTGDVVRYLPDGKLVYFGRVDNQVKLRGFRVELGEIESVLAHQPGVREAVVIAHRRSDQDVRLIAYVAPVSGVTLDGRILRHSLADTLPAHMLPSSFVILDALPLTGNGKVDRAALPLPEAASPQAASAFSAVGGEAEQRIAAVWCELLGVERVGVDDNFFDLGGHSLLVIPLRDRLQEMFGRPVSPVDVFRLPTVASQARFMSDANTGSASAGSASGAKGVSPASSSDDAVRQVANRRREAVRQNKDKRQNRA